MEYIFTTLVASYFRDLASAPKLHWQAGGGAPALEQEPKLLLGACSQSHRGLWEAGERRRRRRGWSLKGKGHLRALGLLTGRSP
jgi:hypothetical protein